MGEHKFNPVVKLLAENPGLKISSQEVKRMHREAHRKAIEAYYRDHPTLVSTSRRKE